MNIASCSFAFGAINWRQLPDPLHRFRAGRIQSDTEGRRLAKRILDSPFSAIGTPRSDRRLGCAPVGHRRVPRYPGTADEDGPGVPLGRCRALSGSGDEEEIAVRAAEATARDVGHRNLDTSEQYAVGCVAVNAAATP